MLDDQSSLARQWCAVRDARAEIAAGRPPAAGAGGMATHRRDGRSVLVAARRAAVRPS